MKKYILLTIALFSIWQIQAQQDAQYTQFMFNKLAFNPAYAGSNETACFTGLYRSQWVGIDGAPISQNMSYHQGVLGNRVGIGVNLQHDKIGPTDSWKGNLIYSYRMKLKKGTLAFGVQGTLRRYQVDWEGAQLTQANDNLVQSAKLSSLLANFGAGLYYEEEKFYMGFSVPHLIKSDISLLAESFATSDVTSLEENHVFAMAGIVLPLSQQLKFKPAGLVKYVSNTPIDFDLNLSLLFFDKVMAGLTYRLGGSTQQGAGESIDIVTQFIASKNLRIGAAFDFTLSELSSYQVGTFEVMMQYCIQHNENVSNPRFF